MEIALAAAVLFTLISLCVAVLTDETEEGAASYATDRVSAKSEDQPLWIVRAYGSNPMKRRTTAWTSFLIGLALMIAIGFSLRI